LRGRIKDVVGVSGHVGGGVMSNSSVYAVTSAFSTCQTWCFQDFDDWSQLS
jgi:uncharacterized protein (DUF697 family)